MVSMSVARGRILRSLAPGNIVSLRPSERPDARTRGRIVKECELHARLAAERITRETTEKLEKMRLHAQAELAEQQLLANIRARARALLAIVAQAVALQRRRQQLEAAGVERTIEIARLLAERLLGETLKLQPQTIASLARQALREATGARRAIIFAHPEDAEYLQGAWAAEPSILDSLEVKSDDSLPRGHLRVETELGQMDADIGGQLDRLAEQLKKLLITPTSP